MSHTPNFPIFTSFWLRKNVNQLLFHFICPGLQQLPWLCSPAQDKWTSLSRRLRIWMSAVILVRFNKLPLLRCNGAVARTQIHCTTVNFALQWTLSLAASLDMKQELTAEGQQLFKICYHKIYCKTSDHVTFPMLSKEIPLRLLKKGLTSHCLLRKHSFSPFL